MESPRQEYWSGFPCPPPVDFPNPGIKPAPLMSPVLPGGFLPLVLPKKPLIKLKIYRTKGFPDSSTGRESTCKAGKPGSVPGSGRSPGEGIGYPLQYSWASLVAQLVKNPPAMRETWVQSLGWEDPWRRERLPTPVFWPREFHGLHSPWGWKESDMTE